MANVNSISNSNSYTSSIYGNKNILSGLASGMDTESMIQNSVSGYETKINQLKQQQEKLTWKQDAYRGITDQMIAINEKYSSYSSTTNLTSPSFFSKAVTTAATGTHAAKISATGKATSDIQINSVSRLASAARYAVSADALGFQESVHLTGDAIALTNEEGAAITKTVSSVTGSLSLRLGTGSYTLDFTESDVYDSAEKLVEGINKKLEDQEVKAKATLEGGKITFTSTDTGGDSVYISGASGDFKSVLGVQSASSSAATNRYEFKSIDVGGKTLSKEVGMAEYLSGKTVNVTLDGVTKSVSLGELKDDSGEYLTDGNALYEKLQSNLNSNLARAFGNGAVTASVSDSGNLSFAVRENSGSSLQVKSDAAELGLGKGLSNVFDASRNLGTLLGEDYFKARGQGEITGNDTDGYTDSTGARTDKDGYLLDEKGEAVYEARELVINGESVGSFDKDTALETLLENVNKNTAAGVSVSYSNLTGQFVFTAKETGAGGKIEFGDGLASRLFEQQPSTLSDVFGKGWSDLKISLGGTKITLLNQDSGASIADQIQGFRFSDEANIYVTGADGREQSFTLGQLKEFASGAARMSAMSSPTYTKGEDAAMNITVNGQTMDLQRSGNTINMDGLSVTLKGTFETGADEEAVSFSTSSDADKIVDAVKGFVEGVNAVLKDVHDAYATRPLTKNSKGETYLPLTEEDKSGMSESAVKAYEEKAKTGILFGDSDLSSMYSRLRSVLTSSDLNLASIGLTSTYSDGVTQISLNEAELRSALESDPDKVQDIFTRSRENGASSDGLMQRFKSVYNTYASKTYGSYGILVNKAGTKLSSMSLLNNSVQKQIDNYEKQIDSWQTKLSDRIDYYTKQFTALEKLMSTMNSQSSMLAQMMGY